MSADTTIQVDFGDEEIPDEAKAPAEDEDDLDDYFASHQAHRVVYQTSHFFVPQIHDLITNKKTINVRPEYQRRLRWSRVQKSALIESMLLNIPIPPIYLYENAAARYEVMDGQQRLNAIMEFLEDAFTLSNLKILSQLNGLRYSRCSPRVKRALDRGNISAIVLLLESDIRYAESAEAEPRDLRRLVFDRLNTGGRALFPQEIRNALNPGSLNDALIHMTRLPIFTTIFGIPPYEELEPDEFYENKDRRKNTLYRSMKDCELALRFFALRSPGNIQGAMKQILDRAMETKLAEDEAQTLIQEFDERLQFLYDLFDTRPFHIDSHDEGKNRVYAGMYDSAMVAVDHYWDRRLQIRKCAADVRNRLRKAVSNDEHYELLTARRNTADAVRARIKLFKEILLPEGRNR